MGHKPSEYDHLVNGLYGASMGGMFRVMVDVMTKSPGAENTEFWIVMCLVPLAFAGVILLCGWLDERP